MQLLKNNVLVVCVCGLAGSGKDTFAQYLKDVHYRIYKDKDRTMDIVTSYTTRKMRVGEVADITHHYLKEIPKDVEIFAYAKYGDAEYWTTEHQMRVRERTIYVVDEKSIAELVKRSDLSHQTMQEYKDNIEGDHTLHWTFNVFSILVTASDSVRRERCKDEERLQRDLDRDMSIVEWDAVIDNNGSKDDLYECAKKIHTIIMKKKY